MSSVVNLISTQGVEVGGPSITTFEGVSESYSAGEYIVSAVGEHTSSFSGYTFYLVLASGTHVGKTPTKLTWRVSSVVLNGGSNSPDTGFYRSTGFETYSGLDLVAPQLFADTGGTITEAGPYISLWSGGTITQNDSLLAIRADYSGVPWVDIEIHFDRLDIEFAGEDDRFWKDFVRTVEYDL